MSEKLNRNIYKSIDFNLPLILCVSGGKDSVCLLHLIMRYRDKFNILPEVVHFNHGLRKKSKSEEDFMKSLCDKFEIPLKIFKLNVKEYSAMGKFSIEESARLLRYKKLTDYSSFKGGKGYIFTAHTSGDQLETVVFRLIKGTGKTGLSGIRKEMKLPSGWIVKRPLLEVTVEEIKKYIKENNIKFCTDKSNFNLDIPRNFIRHRIIKYLKILNPSVEKNIAKEVNIWTEEEDYLKKKVDKAVSEVNVIRSDGRIHIELKNILSYTMWLQRRILKSVSPVELDYNKTDSLLKLIYTDGCSSYIKLGSGWNARKEYDNLIFERSIPDVFHFEYRIIPGKEFDIKEIEKTVKMNLIKSYIEPVQSKNVEIFDADKLNLNGLKVRSRKKGDRITLLGMNGEKKVKDLCIDLKLPLHKRNSIAIFMEGNRVLWAAPHRRSNIALVTEDTENVLKIEIT